MKLGKFTCICCLLASSRVGHSLILKMIDRSFSVFRSIWKSERAIALFVALFKRAKKERSLIRSFAKSDKKRNRSITLFKQRMSERSLNCSFERSGKERWVNEQMSDWPTLQPGLAICSFWKWASALFFEWKTSNLENRSFFAHFCSFDLFERANEQLFFLSLFFKEQKSDRSFRRSFEKNEKRAIAHSLFCKEQQKEQSLTRSF